MPAKKTKKKIEISKDEVVLKTLELSASLGWEHVTLRDIADASGVGLVELHVMFADKFDVLAHLGRMIDARVLDAIGEINSETSPRDALFDVLMERYEILNDYRDGLISILHAFRFDPKQAVISAPHLCRSMSWMLEVSGLDTNGIRGAFKVMGLTAIYMNVLRIWVKDESPDLGKTMAALDKDLGRAERYANMFGF